MDFWKHIRGCSTGGAIGVGVALMISPALWWLGILAGFIAGYFAYEFKDVIRALPKALAEISRGSAEAATGKFNNLLNWFKRPHQFIYPAAVIILPFSVYGTFIVVEATRLSGAWSEIPDWRQVVLFPIAIIDLLGVALIPVAAGSAVLFTLAFIGARIGEKCYWRPFFGEDVMSVQELAYELDKLREKGYTEAPLTYYSAMRWVVIGVGVILKFFLWTIWVKTVMAFARLTHLVHTKKRLVVGIDSATGVAATGMSFGTQAASSGEFVFMLAAGALIAAAVGMLHYHLYQAVAQRLAASSATS